ncbi:MAG: hypothetical protein KME14_25370 [Tildeniella torsiva UHER 1998/13D]|jgi:hypothetical protein|nr:hypothetical protein [Tildeniella torsiva UHER 1998/13D]
MATEKKKRNWSGIQPEKIHLQGLADSVLAVSHLCNGFPVKPFSLQNLETLDPLTGELYGGFESGHFLIGRSSYHPFLPLSTLSLLSKVCLPEEENLKDSRSSRACENWGEPLKG